MHRRGNHQEYAGLAGKDGYVDQLLKRHEELEQKIHTELRRPALDWDGVKLLKREKLRVLETLRARAQVLQ
ncbi:MAG: DUF465 domain-containing protein [Alphaproteobacteria bacterium CG_4_10_14_0_8_um_filter_53_9]|nr:MAG: DUF465 domain-containing protein [Alphaproteobacteria bacterium CG_4_10_14_0_8_um_filter_53_9]